MAIKLTCACGKCDLTKQNKSWVRLCELMHEGMDFYEAVDKIKEEQDGKKS